MGGSDNAFKERTNKMRYPAGGGTVAFYFVQHYGVSRPNVAHEAQYFDEASESPKEMGRRYGQIEGSRKSRRDLPEIGCLTVINSLGALYLCIYLTSFKAHKPPTPR